MMIDDDDDGAGRSCGSWVRSNERLVGDTIIFIRRWMRRWMFLGCFIRMVVATGDRLHGVMRQSMAGVLVGNVHG
jgi:hypothetical protein